MDIRVPTSMNGLISTRVQFGKGITIIDLEECQSIEPCKNDNLVVIHAMASIIQSLTMFRSAGGGKSFHYVKSNLNTPQMTVQNRMQFTKLSHPSSLQRMLTYPRSQARPICLFFSSFLQPNFATRFWSRGDIPSKFPS